VEEEFLLAPLLGIPHLDVGKQKMKKKVLATLASGLICLFAAVSYFSYIFVIFFTEDRGIDASPIIFKDKLEKERLSETITCKYIGNYDMFVTFYFKEGLFLNNYDRDYFKNVQLSTITTIKNRTKKRTFNSKTSGIIFFEENYAGIEFHNAFRISPFYIFSKKEVRIDFYEIDKLMQYLDNCERIEINFGKETVDLWRKI